MEKTVIFKMSDQDIVITVKSEDAGEKTQTIKNRTLNAKEIYDLLAYKLGDTYVYEDIQCEGKEKGVLEQLQILFKSITDQISDLNSEE